LHERLFSTIDLIVPPFPAATRGVQADETFITFGRGCFLLNTSRAPQHALISTAAGAVGVGASTKLPVLGVGRGAEFPPRGVSPTDEEASSSGIGDLVPGAPDSMEADSGVSTFSGAADSSVDFASFGTPFHMMIATTAPSAASMMAPVRTSTVRRGGRSR